MTQVGTSSSSDGSGGGGDMVGDGERRPPYAPPSAPLVRRLDLDSGWTASPHDEDLNELEALTPTQEDALFHVRAVTRMMHYNSLAYLVDRAQRLGFTVEGAAPHTALPLAMLFHADAAHSGVLARVVVRTEALARSQRCCDCVRAARVHLAALAESRRALALALRRPSLHWCSTSEVAHTIPSVANRRFSAAAAQLLAIVCLQSLEQPGLLHLNIQPLRKRSIHLSVCEHTF